MNYPKKVDSLELTSAKVVTETEKSTLLEEEILKILKSATASISAKDIAAKCRLIPSIGKELPTQRVNQLLYKKLSTQGLVTLVTGDKPMWKIKL